jgi:non-homologous end joining protein Ku
MPINSGILSFGLVAIPVKLYPAIKDQTVRFHLLLAKCGSRVRNRFWCPVCNEVVDRPRSSPLYSGISPTTLSGIFSS